MIRTPPIRWQISVLRLMSTLNAVILGTDALALFRVLAESPSGARVSAVQSFEIQLEGVQTAALDATATGAPIPERVFDNLRSARAGLDPVGPDAQPVQAELSTYEDLLRRWNSHVDSAAHFSFAGSEDAAGEGIAHELVRSDLRITEAARHLVYYVRPPWVDVIAPALPWLGGWLLMCTAVTVVLAGGLRQVLSRPLDELRRAADAVASGQLNVQIPEPVGAAEVQSLSRAMSAAQARLVATIAVLDTRNHQTATMLAQLGDGVILADESGKILEHNAQAHALLSSLSFRWPRCDRLPELLPEIGVERLREEEDAHLELSRTTAGRRIVVECSIRQVPLATPTSPRSWVVVLRDVTAARQVDSLQREFLSVVTHELKTPLVTIEGFAKLLLMQKGGPLTEKQLGWVTTIREQGQVLLQMVTNLLDATRLEGGNLTITMAVVPARDCFGQWCQTWRPVVEGRGLQFAEHDSLGADGVGVRVDTFRLAQVVGNLVNNALKFTPPGGEIGLSLAREGNEVVFTVHDSGRGIPAEAVPRLFEKFYQVEKGDTRVAGGAGLGLYIVNQLVLAQGGRIVVHSEVDRGSRFSVYFPIPDPGELS